MAVAARGRGVGLGGPKLPIDDDGLVPYAFQWLANAVARLLLNVVPPL